MSSGTQCVRAKGITFQLLALLDRNELGELVPSLDRVAVGLGDREPLIGLA